VSKPSLRDLLLQAADLVPRWHPTLGSLAEFEGQLRGAAAGLAPPAGMPSAKEFASTVWHGSDTSHSSDVRASAERECLIRDAQHAAARAALEAKYAEERTRSDRAAAAWLAQSSREPLDLDSQFAGRLEAIAARLTQLEAEVEAVGACNATLATANTAAARRERVAHDALLRISKLDAHKRSGCVAAADGETLCSEFCPVGIAVAARAALKEPGDG
jgi:hypothetical protein